MTDGIYVRVKYRDEICFEQKFRAISGDTIVITVDDLVAEKVAEEREACWQIAHDTYEGFGSNAKGVDYVKHHIMKQIRARGQE